jgi:hypothetical protein
MINERVRTKETVIAVLKSSDGSKRVIQEKWYHKFLRRPQCQRKKKSL